MKASQREEYKEFLKDSLNYLRFQKDLGWEGFANPEKDFTLENVTAQTKIPSGISAPERGRENKLLTLEDVRKELGDCQRCRLCKERTNIVFGTGNEHAKLIFIGEGPGRDEDLKGEPFVGRAGQLLTKIINAMGLKRQDVYITNVVKCRPPGNRNPLPDEIAACEPFLIKQLEAIKPKLICALGTVAAQALLKTDKRISELRGKFFYYRGIKLLPTFHPAYLLRNPEYKKAVWEDMQLLMKEYAKLED
ncbi:MAG: uracil-DNA glycosylase [Candidatus Tectomicrobia bacterium]|uniref:Type-4 uracil-DNA glycosylase n=1 Tax=Tectimicrobiota bacterium TaxID=2528274 RepID=A0A933GK77_UNCTE|nr:uracil-DNA glycosylase [Candidatus Tectomicrobia bacterium]